MEINQSDEVIPWSVDTTIHELQAEIDRLRTEVEDYKATALSLLDCIETLLKTNTTLREDLDHIVDTGADRFVIVGDDGKPLQHDFDGNLKETNENTIL